MLTSVLRALVNNLVKKKFYGKKNFNVFFFIFHKSDVKTFLKWIVNQCPKGTRKHFPKTITKFQNHLD